jgi:hypothetical protein
MMQPDGRMMQEARGEAGADEGRPCGRRYIGP